MRMDYSFNCVTVNFIGLKKLLLFQYYNYYETPELLEERKTDEETDDE